DTMAILCPVIRLSSVDLPTLGRPMMAANPDLNGWLTVFGRSPPVSMFVHVPALAPAGRAETAIIFQHVPPRAAFTCPPAAPTAAARTPGIRPGSRKRRPPG